MRDRSKALHQAVDDHILAVRGTKWWPDDPRARPMPARRPGASIEEVNAELRAEQDARTRASDMISGSGEIRGPQGFVRPFTIVVPTSSSSVSKELQPDSIVELRPKDNDGLFDFAVGAAVGERTWAASRTGVLPGQTVALPFGDGYSMTIALTRRDATPDEQRMNNRLADMIARTMAEGGPPLPPPADSTLPPPVEFSPFTNSVIRQGAPAK